MSVTYWWPGFVLATIRGFQDGSEASGSTGQSSKLWQTATSDHSTCIYLHSLLSSPVLSFPLFYSSVRTGGGGRQITLLPQKLPITAWECIQHCCLKNAEFVNRVQLKGICELNFSCHLKWVKYYRCMDMRMHTVWLKLETNHFLLLLFIFDCIFYITIKPGMKTFTTYNQKTFITAAAQQTWFLSRQEFSIAAVSHSYTL